MYSDTSLFRFIKNSISTGHPALKILMLFFGMFTFMLITTLVGNLGAFLIFHLSWQESVEMFSADFSHINPAVLKYFQAVQSIGFFLLPGIFMPYLLFGNTSQQQAKNTWHQTILYLLILATIVASIPVISLLIEWNNQIVFPESLSGLENSLKELEQKANELTNFLLSGTSVSQLLVNLLLIAVIPAIGEELIFRRCIQSLLIDWIRNHHIAILITAIVFSAFHAQFYGFIPRLFLGLYFGYLFVWSGSILTAVWAHFLNNSIAIILTFLASSGEQGQIQSFAEGGEFSVSVVVFAMLITTVLVIVTQKIFRRTGFSTS